MTEIPSKEKSFCGKSWANVHIRVPSKRWIEPLSILKISRKGDAERSCGGRFSRYPLHQFCVMLWKQRNKLCEIVFSGSCICALLFYFYSLERAIYAVHLRDSKNKDQFPWRLWALFNFTNAKKKKILKLHCPIEIMKCPGSSRSLRRDARCVSLLFRDSESGHRQLLFCM